MRRLHRSWGWFLSVSFLMGTVGSLVIPGAYVFASTTSFKQQILPLHCIFQTIDDGTGTLYYVTPKACGVLINPAPGNSNTSSNSVPGLIKRLTVPGYSGTAPAIRSTLTPIASFDDLGELPDFAIATTGLTTKGSTSKTFSATIGQVYGFIVDIARGSNHETDATTEQHTLIVDSIDISDPAYPMVTITLHSTPLTISLHSGQAIRETLIGNGTSNIEITVNGITANSVSLTLRQLTPDQTLAESSPTHSESSNRQGIRAWRYIAIGLGTVIAMVCIAYDNKYVRNKRAKAKK